MTTQTTCPVPSGAQAGVPDPLRRQTSSPAACDGAETRPTLEILWTGSRKLDHGRDAYRSPNVKLTLRDHSEYLITLKNSAWRRHSYESTGRSVRYKRGQIGIRDNVESRRFPMERNGSGASESLA